MDKNTDPKKDKITELQRMLYDLSFFTDPELLVIPDGYYGPETVSAVKKFQQAYRLPVTGETDNATWDKIASAHQHLILNTPFPVKILTDEVCLNEGSICPAVWFLQTMLMALSNEYSSLPVTEVTGIYDRQTTDAVRHMQKLSLYPQTGSADKYTWNNIVRFFVYTVK